MARKQPVVEKDSITEYPKQSIKDIVVDGYTITSKYFAEYRLIPHIIDGLKPVYRRVLQSAYECCKDKFIKTATLGGHVIGCFTGDTEILDVNNQLWSLETLSQRDLTAEPVYTISCNKQGVPEVAKIIQVISKGLRNNLVRVTLDNGEQFTCTSDHKMLMRTGEYVEAGNLKPGNRLMSKDNNNIYPQHIEYLNCTKEVFDVTVDSDNHNFLLKSGVFAKNCYHPHSLDATEEVINELVNAGLLIGDGEFGSKYLDGTIAEAASSRYTSVKLNPVLKDVFDKLLPYIPKKDGELEAKEYEYLPLPLPYMLFRGGFGLGPGLSTKTPAFTMKSMAEALKKNDPSKLKSTYGYTLLDKNQSFKRIWETGNGFMYYKLDTGTETLGDAKGFYLTGSAQVFFPKLTVLEGWKMEGLITIDEVGQGVSKLFIKRNKGVSTITNDEIYRAIEEASEYKDTIILKVIAPDGVVHPIGLQTWLNYSYNKFLELVNLYREDRIKAIQKKIDLMKDLDVVRKYIIDHIKDSKCTPEMIAKATKKDISVVKEIDSWTVNKLRNTVVADELKKLNEQMHEAKQFDCNAYVNHVLKALDESCM